MLTDDDLQAAADAGVISQHQATDLRNFIADRNTLSDAAGPGEERFAFYRGFNDIFIAIGVALLGAGLFLLLVYSASLVPALIIAFVVAWGLAEFLTGRMRLVLSSILLAIAITSIGATLVAIIGAGLSKFSQVDVANIWWIFSAPVVASIHYLRFRLPFSLLIITATATGTVLVALHKFAPGQADDLTTVVIFIGGIASFAAAMMFDLKDPGRTSRFSDCAFWLHLIAAPMIVHPLVSWLVPNLKQLDGAGAASILIVTLVVACIALLVDRRAMLVSSLIYAGTAIGYTLRQTEAESNMVLIITLGILGLAVILLGAGWAPARTLVLKAVPSSLLPYFVRQDS